MKNASSFNHDLGNWKTFSVRYEIFHRNTSFNQDISDWNISSVTDLNDSFFNASALSNGNKGLIHHPFLPIRTALRLDGSFPLRGPYQRKLGTAVDLWFDKAAAFAAYGHISDWDVSAVTNMSNASRTRRPLTMTSRMGCQQCHEHTCFMDHPL